MAREEVEAKNAQIIQEQAMQYQRNGNLRALASIAEQITELEAQINE